MNLKNCSDDELAAEIERRRMIEEKNAMPKPLPNPDFTKLIATCEGIVEDIAREKYNRDDNQHWIYEAAIDAIYGKKYWGWLNNIC